MKNNHYQYYVEGECEKKLLEVLKEQKNWIISGKVEVFNAKQKKISNMKLRQFGDNTTIILVFDTDTVETDFLLTNLNLLRRSPKIKEVWCVLQVANLEDELCRSTNIREIKDLLDCKTNREFKHDFIKETKLFEKLQKHGFDFTKIWISRPQRGYEEIKNEGIKIKKKV